MVDQATANEGATSAPVSPLAPPASPPGPEPILSISEQATANSSRRFNSPRILKRIYETPFRTKNPTHGRYLDEVTAWGMDAAGRGPLNQAGSYIGVAIIILASMDAERDAGCLEEAENPAQCPARVYGLRPSSLLTMASVVVGIASAISMPFVGAIVDHTSHRKTVGAATAFLVCAVTGIQIFLSGSTWFACLILEIVGGYALIMHFMSVMAYLPDLSPVEDDLAYYTAHFNMKMYVFQLLYVSIVIGIGSGLELGSVNYARVAVGLAFIASILLFGYSWLFLFRKRPPLRKVPEGTSIYSAGPTQLWRTSKLIVTKYNSLKWFMFALLWTPESGAGVVLSIVVTYLNVVITMENNQIAITNLILLIFTVPGSYWAIWFMRRFNPLNSFRWSLVFFICVLAFTLIFVNGPDRLNWTYGAGVFWGIAYGWMNPSQRTLQVTLTPRGQEAEIMGLFTFVTQVIGWLPALIFSVLNENGVDMRWGVSVVCWEVAVAVVCLLFVGDYDDAVWQVQKEAEPESDEEAAKAEITETKATIVGSS